jgi:hypothetical protein
MSLGAPNTISSIAVGCQNYSNPLVPVGGVTDRGPVRPRWRVAYSARSVETVVAVLLGCGLRRAGVAALGVQDLQQREEHWVFADLVGKGDQVRTVPVPDGISAGTARLDGGGQDHGRSDLSRDQQSGTDCRPRVQSQGGLGRCEGGLLGLHPW